MLLESRNFIVTTVNDGVHALREVMAFDFDVIICDLLMPNMPGDMFYLAVQKTKPELCKRFLFVTGHGFWSALDGKNSTPTWSARVLSCSIAAGR